jgi:hypothetical protein|mmetsp:Transcript_71270/g.119253  ORF Transcript_71270/g.119253 Transcript_71270/m.119253 type:complete len:92 (-) Transcript_71270:98-373(-)|eukprot:CAMPEP_0174312934 /NCGR_PEP_ID=MMETSP0810-20121108/4633_1 /TAXON_ID=73025 ORGANISM="Eutreptiella gymnastica-like, Strain CCMP1594" /NCGR_SAMPLE_ID=MMETSP0810 /ASSEMBLY_ACC=CAM_ASM_000659 /LENGTH=91 /DNA_ID=CAMNT_0015421517 /DNA_START=893 /DNA_END=1168 /DNA_ORIENTATION=+
MMKSTTDQNIQHQINFTEGNVKKVAWWSPPTRMSRAGMHMTTSKLTRAEARMNEQRVMQSSDFDVAYYADLWSTETLAESHISAWMHEPPA